MAENLTIEIDITQTLQSVSVFHSKQLPFVTAAALTDTAKLAQQEIRKQMPRKFHLSNPKFLPSGIRIIPAQKKSAEQVATVYSKDDFLEMQETGGTKRPKKSKALSIPTKAFAKESRTGSGKMKRQAWASSLLRGKDSTAPWLAGAMGGRHNLRSGDPKPFAYRIGSKAFIGVRIRGTRRKLKNGRYGEAIRTLYHFAPSATIKPKWNFVNTATGVARSSFDRLFGRRLRKAVGN